MNYLAAAIAMLLASSSVSFAEEPCGIDGNLRDRISDCRSLEPEAENSFAQLVTATPSGNRVYLDITTNLLWGDYRGTATHAKAYDACRSGATDAEGNLTKAKWRLPTAEEFLHIAPKLLEGEITEGNEINTLLVSRTDFPRGMYWTSTRSTYLRDVWRMIWGVDYFQAFGPMGLWPVEADSGVPYRCVADASDL